MQKTNQPVTKPAKRPARGASAAGATARKRPGPVARPELRKRTLSLAMSPEMLERLSAQASFERQSQSVVMGKALTEYLENHGPGND